MEVHNYGNDYDKWSCRASVNEMMDVNGGWSASEFFGGFGLVCGTVVAAAVAVATLPASAPAGLCAAIVFGSCGAAFSGGYMMGDSFWN